MYLGSGPSVAGKGLGVGSTEGPSWVTGSAVEIRKIKEQSQANGAMSSVGC